MRTNDKFSESYLKHFDIELIKRMKIHPFDDLVYSYLKYECKRTKLPKAALIARYEKEIALPAEKANKDDELRQRYSTDMLHFKVQSQLLLI